MTQSQGATTGRKEGGNSCDQECLAPSPVSYLLTCHDPQAHVRPLGWRGAVPSLSMLFLLFFLHQDPNAASLHLRIESRKVKAAPLTCWEKRCSPELSCGHHRGKQFTAAVVAGHKGSFRLVS